MSLLRCLITGGTVTFPSLPPAYLPPTAFRHINSMLRVLELSGCLSQVMTNLVSRRSCGYFNHQCGLFDLDSDALSALRVPLVESMLNPAVLAAAVLCKLNSAASMEPAGNNVIDKTDNWWLDRLVVKQFLAVYARPFLQKTVGSLVGEISAKVAAAADGQTAVDRQQIIEWTQKLLRSLTHHRGLLPRY
jgi:hypothetical protein